MPKSALITEKVDLLNRTEFVDRMITVSEALSENRKNACYALNGAWGVGKSFVLGMFEEQIVQIQSPETTMGKYLLFHYDCWQYDYYEEPLVAIVAAILDAIDKQICLLPADKKEKVKVILRNIGNALLKKANQFVVEKTGIDANGIIDEIKAVNEQSGSAVKETHSFDPHFNFKKLLGELRSTIEDLAKDQTLIFAVDELDRCLPEYTIKVLERLHHVFDGVPNVQLVLSIDKCQLQHSIRQIYGSETSVDRYLAKFIDFEIKLDEGSISDIYNKQFSDYTKFFEKKSEATDIDQMLTMLLSGIDMRGRIAIFEKCKILHELISDNSVMDLSVMCMEILLALIYTYQIDLDQSKKTFNRNGLLNLGTPKADNNQSVPLGLRQFSDQYDPRKTDTYAQCCSEISGTEYIYIYTSSIWGVLLGGYRSLLGFENDIWLHGHQDKCVWVEHIKKFWNLLQIIN